MTITTHRLDAVNMLHDDQTEHHSQNDQRSGVMQCYSVTSIVFMTKTLQYIHTHKTSVTASLWQNYIIFMLPYYIYILKKDPNWLFFGGRFTDISRHYATAEIRLMALTDLEICSITSLIYNRTATYLSGYLLLRSRPDNRAKKR